jgi:uncharacterized protein YbjT (DUF2867 family)
MKIIVTGATGMAGSEVLRQAIRDPKIEQITAIVRRPMQLHALKLREVIHDNFLDYSGLEEVFKQHDACIWCLGISQTQVSRDMYFTITYEYTIAAATAILQANPDINFIFLSGNGADNSEKSSTLFARVKGKTENKLKAMPFKKLYLVRAGAIQPIHKNPRAPFLYKLLLPLFPLAKLLAPSKVITSVELAKAMLFIAKNGYDKQTVENKDLLAIHADL